MDIILQLTIFAVHAVILSLGTPSSTENWIPLGEADGVRFTGRNGEKGGLATKKTFWLFKNVQFLL